MCLLSATTSKFPKYPRLPVIRCSGYEPQFAHSEGRAMPGKKRAKPAKSKVQAATRQLAILKGWQATAGFLGQPVDVAQRWSRSAMPVEDLR
jgi:hypothetical protein